ATPTTSTSPPTTASPPASCARSSISGARPRRLTLFTATPSSTSAPAKAAPCWSPVSYPSTRSSALSLTPPWPPPPARTSNTGTALTPPTPPPPALLPSSYLSKTPSPSTFHSRPL